ncbi:ankyrin repeat domain-containing protein [Candidatus Phycorickettsia trachydisci]
MKNFYGYNMDEIMTPLHIAVLNKEYSAAAWLCDQGVNVNAQNYNGDTAMHLAAKMDDWLMVKLLALSGGNIHLFNKAGQNVAQLAFYKGYIGVVQRIFEQKANLQDDFSYGHKLSHIAVKYDHIDLLQKLIEKKYQIDGTNNLKETALHYAAQKNYLNTITLLINAGAKVDSKDIYKQTPLHHAVQHGNLDAVKTLYQKGADLYAEDINNANLVHIAAQYGRLDILKWVNQEQKLGIHYLDNEEELPIHYAARNGEVEIIEYFRNKKCDVYVKNSYNENPLFIAAIEGQIDVVKHYCEKLEASINSVNVEGDYLIHIAAFEGHLPLLKYLIQNGADINAQNSEDNTPLHVAICSKELEIISFLKDNGANINIKNEYNQTALICALDHELDPSLFLTPETELDLSNIELYEYLIRNIDEILSRKTLREKILIGIKILNDFKDLEDTTEAKEFTENLSRKLMYIIESSTENFLGTYVLQQKMPDLLERTIVEIRELEDIFKEALNFIPNPSIVKNALNYARSRINSYLVSEKASTNLSKQDTDNYGIDIMSNKFKHLLKNSEEAKPCKVQKICNKVIKSDDLIQEKYIESFDDTSNNSLKVMGEISEES